MNDDLAREILEELRKQTAHGEEALALSKQTREEMRKRLDDSTALVAKARRESRWTLLATVGFLVVLFAWPAVSTWFQMRDRTAAIESELEDQEEIGSAYRPGPSKYQASAYAQSGQYEMLDLIEDSLLLSFPLDAEVQQILAKSHFDRGDLAKARTLFQTSESLLHDESNVRHLEAIARRESELAAKP